MADWRAWLTRSPLPRRVLLFVAGLALVAASAYVVFHVLPSNQTAQPGEEVRIDERFRAWTPEEGWTEGLRTRTVAVVDDPAGLALRERVEGAASPRGASFSLPVDGALNVEGEPAVRAGFPATPLFGEPRETVYLAVPWADDGHAAVGAIDTFHRSDVVDRDGTGLVEYNARHVAQFFVHDDKIWYRATARTVLVEPLTGDVVDYDRHETLWIEPMPVEGLPHGVHELTTERERVWEAHVEPTATAQAALLERAQHHRAERLEELAAVGLPILGLGDVFLWAAIAARPRRVFPE